MHPDLVNRYDAIRSQVFSMVKNTTLAEEIFNHVLEHLIQRYNNPKSKPIEDIQRYVHMQVRKLMASYKKYKSEQKTGRFPNSKINGFVERLTPEKDLPNARLEELENKIYRALHHWRNKDHVQAFVEYMQLLKSTWGSETNIPDYICNKYNFTPENWRKIRYRIIQHIRTFEE